MFSILHILPLLKRHPRAEVNSNDFHGICSSVLFAFSSSSNTGFPWNKMVRIRTMTNPMEGLGVQES
jgi:hypothetical protein